MWPSHPKLNDVISFLKLKGNQAFALFIVCAAVVLLAHFKLLYLDVIPNWLRTVFVVLGIAGFVVWLLGLWEWLLDKQKQRREKAQQEEYEDNIIDELGRLSHQEQAILGYMLDKNISAQAMDWKDEDAGSLLTRGILVRSEDYHPQTDWPHSVRDFVWRALQEDDLKEVKEALIKVYKEAPKRN